MFLYVENSKELFKLTYQRLINKFSKFGAYMINIKVKLHFFIYIFYYNVPFFIVLPINFFSSFSEIQLIYSTV